MCIEDFKQAWMRGSPDFPTRIEEIEQRLHHRLIGDRNLNPITIVSPTRIFPQEPTVGFFLVVPIERIAAFGGFMIPLKKSIPNMPRLVTVKLTLPFHPA